jgi:RNA polymerase sigma-70 factor (ECF subfamily)
MDTYSDIELVRRSVSGDARAFEHLVTRHYMSVYRISYKWSGVRHDAEDIAQEVFVKLARKLKTFRQQSSFTTWLYRIVINTAKDFTRKCATARAYESAFAFEHNPENPGPPEGRHQTAARLYKELAKLPEKQRMAIVLVLGEGLSHRQAANVLNCPEATVSWRIFQARKKLKKSLEHLRYPWKTTN